MIFVKYKKLILENRRVTLCIENKTVFISKKIIGLEEKEFENHRLVN